MIYPIKIFAQSGIVTFDFVALAGGEATATNNFKNALLQDSIISRGAGVVASANAQRFNGTGFNASSLANAISSNDYYEFSITPLSGNQFSVTSLFIQHQGSGTGPTNFAIRGSHDGFGSDLGVFNRTGTVTEVENFNLSGVGALQNRSVALTLRVYGFGGAVAGSWGMGDGASNDIVVGGSTAVGAASVLTNIVLNPINPSVITNGTVQFFATGQYSGGEISNLTTQVNWVSTNLAVATINGSGLATGVGAGVTLIVADKDGVTNSTTLTVTNAPAVSVLTNIVLNPINPSVITNGTVQFFATGQYSGGEISNLTTQVNWVSTNLAVATINGSGLATGVGAGVTLIVADKDGVTNSTTLTVTNLIGGGSALTNIVISPQNPSVITNGTVQFSATGQYSGGEISNLTTQVNWVSTNLAVATIDANGLASAVGAGVTLIVADKDGVTNSTTLTVTNVPPAGGGNNIVTFDFVALAGGEATATNNFKDVLLQDSIISRGAGVVASANAQRFNGTGFNASSLANAISSNDYYEFTITPVVGNQFSVTSLFIQHQGSGTGPTNFAIRGSHDGFGSDLGVFNRVGTVTEVENFDVSGVGALQNRTTALSLRVYGFGGAVAGSWGMGDGTGNDIVVGGSTASVGGSVLTNITISPVNPSVITNGTVQFSATGQYSGGESSNLTTLVNWISTNMAVATIDASGLATGMSAGQTLIVANKDGVTNSTTLTVTLSSPTLVSLNVLPNTASNRIDRTNFFIAEATFQQGTNQFTSNVTAAATWISTNMTVAVIQGSGVSIAQSFGVTRIEATYQSLTNGARLVIAGPGDVNYDGFVNLNDFQIIADAFGSDPSSPNWNPEADLDFNAVNNIDDVQILQDNFNQDYTAFYP